MSAHFVEQFTAGRNLLLRLGPNGAAPRTPDTRSFRGDLSLAPVEIGDQRIGFDMVWLGIVSRSISTPQGPSGKMSISGIAGKGDLSPSGPGRWSLVLELKADVLYDAIEERLGFHEVEPGQLEPVTETFQGRFSATLTEGEDGQGLGLNVLFSDLDLSYVEGGLGWIPRLRIPVSMLPPAAMWSALAPPQCPASNQAGKRKLKIRPFAFRSGAGKFDHSGTSWPAQIAAAKAIWSGCCLELEDDPLALLENDDLRTSTDPQKIQLALPASQDLEGIEVFLVDGILPAGGGSTSAPGHAHAKVVITNRNAGNPNLLAHELGHVLGGRHPGGNPNGKLWAADPGTVLEPSNSPNLANPGRNSLGNCRRARNPALLVTPKTCCLSPAQ